MLQVLYQRYPLLVHLGYSLLLLLFATACQPEAEGSYTSRARAETAGQHEAADPIRLLSELSEAFAEDSVPLARILGASPASLSRLMSRESSPTPEFQQQLSSTHRLYRQSGRDTRILRHPLVLILPLFTLFFLWIVALIYTSLTPCRGTHDHYRQQLNPKVERPREALRPS